MILLHHFSDALGCNANGFLSCSSLLQEQSLAVLILPGFCRACRVPAAVSTALGMYWGCTACLHHCLVFLQAPPQPQGLRARLHCCSIPCSKCPLLRAVPCTPGRLWAWGKIPALLATTECGCSKRCLLVCSGCLQQVCGWYEQHSLPTGGKLLSGQPWSS